MRRFFFPEKDVYMSSLPVSPAPSQDLDSTLREYRVFPPPEEFSRKAHIKSLEQYETLYKQSIEDPEAFWASAARELHWFKPWDKVLEWDLPHARWFAGGQMNLSYNCIDRHLDGPRRDKTALIWEGEPGEVRRLTYAELHVEVQKFANALKALGIKKGDRIAIYMGMTPELAIALLACARIGVIHSVIFGGFAANAIADRVNDSGCVAIITQDSSYRRGNEIQLRRRGNGGLPHRGERHCLPPHRLTGHDGYGSRPLVARPDSERSHRVPRRAHGFRGPALHPLHLRHYRQTQGAAPHHGRVRRPNLPDHQVRLRPQRRGRLLVHGRHRLGYRPLLRDLRPAAKWRDGPDV
jgi:rRNA-processing protein FCF1